MGTPGGGQGNARSVSGVSIPGTQADHPSYAKAVRRFSGLPSGVSAT